MPVQGQSERELAAYIQGGPRPVWLDELPADQRQDADRLASSSRQGQVRVEGFGATGTDPAAVRQYAEGWATTFLTSGVNRRPAGTLAEGQQGTTGGGGPGTGGGAGGQGGTAEQRDAFAVIKDMLRRYGLDTLADWAWDQIVGGATESQVNLLIRERKEFRQRFPGIEERQKRGFGAISPAEYLEYESRTRQMLRAAGLPTGFYDDPSDFTKFIAGDVSLAEVQARVNEGYSAVANAPAEVRDEFLRFNGVSLGSLAAYFIDPDRALPIIQRQVAAAQLGGAAVQSGFGRLTRTEAEEISTRGVTQEQAERGFGELVEMEQVFAPLPGQETAEETIGREAQLGAMFGGNAQQRRRIRRQQERRLAEFGGGGGFAAGREGLVGLGASS